MKGIKVTVKLNDGGTLSLTEDADGFVLGRIVVRPGKHPQTHTLRLTKEEITNLPLLIQRIGTIL